MTRLDEVQHPLRPKFQQQGPDSNCQIDGKMLGWDSCTAYSMAMLIDRASGGRKQPSGCSVRRYTGDTSGGLTLNQVAYVAETQFATPIDVRVGSNVVNGAWLARQIRAGKPAVVQGNAAAMIGTKWRSTGGDVNHAVYVNEVRGGTLDIPAEALVYDPAADGRTAGWGTADQGPSWWPWSLVLKFAASLRPNGPGTPRIGPGRIYCGVGPDTEPHVTLLSGAVKASPFPDRVRAADPDDPTTAIHHKPAPRKDAARFVKNGTLLRIYQYRDGWGYSDTGTECVLLRNTNHVGGSQ